jgi:purine-binding chemotaxis protein CheW
VLSAPPGERTEPALVFTLGHAEFALPSACIVEIIRAPANLTRMPQAPALVEGLTQLRGRVVPVVNAASLLMGSDPSTAVRDMIVFRWGDREAGLLVNGISHILRVPIASHHTAATPAGANLLLSRRINLVGGKKLVILDPEEIFAHVTRALRSETHEKMAAQVS